MWSKESSRSTWTQAKAYCAALTTGGHNDWNNKDNFEQIYNYISNLPLRTAKGLFAFYKNEMKPKNNLLDKLSEKQKILY